MLRALTATKWSGFSVINIIGDAIFFWKLLFILILSTYLITEALSLQILNGCMTLLLKVYVSIPAEGFG